MKKGFNILLILCAALVAISCSKTKSYTDMLKDEKKAIERFIDDKGLEILDDFPADSVLIREAIRERCNIRRKCCTVVR